MAQEFTHEQSSFAIFQGPRFSFGTGPNRSVTGFDSREYFIQNLARISKNTRVILSSTTFVDYWDLSDYSHEFKFHYVLPRNSKLNDNRLTQRDGLIRVLKSLPSDSKVFISRPDMLYPASIWDWFSDFDQQHDLITSELLPIPGYIGDFFLIARRELLINIFSVPHSINHNVSNIELGMSLLNATAGIEKQSDHISKLKIRSLWLNVLGRQVYTLNAEIFFDILWRGKRLDTVFKNRFLFLTKGEDCSKIPFEFGYQTEIYQFLRLRFPRLCDWSPLGPLLSYFDRLFFAFSRVFFLFK